MASDERKSSEIVNEKCEIEDGNDHNDRIDKDTSLLKNEENVSKEKGVPVNPTTTMEPPSSVFKMPIMGPKFSVKKTSTPKEFIETDDKSKETSKDVTKEQPKDRETPSDSGKQKQPSVSSKVSNLLNLSPAELAKSKSIPIPYKEPSWGGVGGATYSFEVVKNGTVIDTLDISSKSFHVFGRLPSCDFPMEHPSLSRYHAVVQFCSKNNELHDIGWYLYDLDSTHGTWINKTRVKPRVYNRLRVGYVVKFGGSTRLHIMQGPDEDADEESELTITEMKEQRERQRKEAEVLKAAELAQMEEKKAAIEKASSDEGCMWGMDQEAVAEETSENPFASIDPPNEELYIDDPKKALRGFYEREGLDLPDYKVDEEGRGKFRCYLELPLDGPNGEPIIAEATVSGKKREAVVACALEGCRILDRMGELRKSHHESRKRKAKDWAENDYYDSDEDTFLDRTGDIEKKRQQRMKRSKSASSQKAASYEELKANLQEVEAEMEGIQKRLDEAKADAASYEDADGVDALDAFMESIKSGGMDTKTKMSLKKQLFGLKTEQQRLIKLANIAKPPDMPPLKSSFSPLSNKNKHTLPMFGKMRGPAIPQRPTPKGVPVQQTISKENDDQPEVEEEDEENTQNSDTKDKETVHMETDNSKQTEVKLKDPKEDDSKMDTSENKDEMNKQNDSKVKQGDDINNSSSGEQTVETTSNKSSKKSIQDRIQRLLGPSKIPEDSPEKNEKSDVQEGENTKKESNSKDSQAEGKKKRRRQRYNKQTAPKEDDVYETSDPLYATWVPPEGQSGDGTTHLNAKFGY